MNPELNKSRPQPEHAGCPQRHFAALKPAIPEHCLACFFIKPGVALKAFKARKSVSFIAFFDYIEAPASHLPYCLAVRANAIYDFFVVFRLSAHILIKPLKCLLIFAVSNA
ncbi:MAG TPA: hypothetical protein VI977_00505 [archaeon]|nr:hypothetical protein [archaeon]